jgi:uncharacterized protein YfaS (alpha-2-macroglobulin family)
MDFLQQQGAGTLTVAKQGAGRLYYRLGLQYAPSSLEMGPSSQGMMVTRSYEPVAGVGKSDDVVQEKDGSYSIKAGATIRVRLTVVVHDRGYYVALDDPLPAGLEAQNMEFQTTAQAPAAEGQGDAAYDSDAWMPLWVWTHKELRDDRAVAFADALPAGVYEYTYLARATTVGDFRAAPTHVEEMYEPEVFGRSATDHVNVIAPASVASP